MEKEEAVYRALKSRSMKRREICEEFDLAWSTAYDLLERMLNKGLVERESVKINHRGRPFVYWKAK